jgi:hypothetical protein
MNTDLTVINAIILINLVAVVVLVIRMRNVDNRLKKVEGFIRGLIAHSKNVPMPTDPDIYRGWLKRHNELVDGPKKTAYRNRLIEVGVMDKDGKVIKKP